MSCNHNDSEDIIFNSGQTELTKKQNKNIVPQCE